MEKLLILTVAKPWNFLVFTIFLIDLELENFTNYWEAYYKYEKQLQENFSSVFIDLLIFIWTFKNRFLKLYKKCVI